MGLYSSSALATTTTTSAQQTYSPEEKARLINIAERQQAMSEDQWNQYKSVFQPYEQEMIAYNRSIMPEMKAATEATLNEAVRDIQQGRKVKDVLRDAMVKETGLNLEVASAQADEILRDIQAGRSVKDALRDAILVQTEAGVRETRARTPVAEKFYSEAAKGIDVGERMGQATADVAQAFKGGAEALRRSAARMGTTVSAKGIRDMAMAEAKAKGLGRTLARRDAETENFNRLAMATGMNTGSANLPGTQSTAAGGLNTSTNLPGISSIGGYTTGLNTVSNPLNAASSLASNAASTYSALSTPTTTQTSTTSGGGSDFGDFAGSMLGLGLGTFTGGIGTGLATSLFN